jgi:hypothetical protein
VQILRESKESLLKDLTPPPHVLSQLRRWQTWLIETNNKLNNMPSIGVGTQLETRFAGNFHAWADLEAVYRPDWWDFVWWPETTCSEESPVLCQVCGARALGNEAVAAK